MTNNNHYVIIRRGVKDHVVEGPYSKQIARLARERYFFTNHDNVCDTTPARLTITHGHSYPITCCSVQELSDWDKGSLNGNDGKNLPRLDPGKLF